MKVFLYRSWLWILFDQDYSDSRRVPIQIVDLLQNLSLYFATVIALISVSKTGTQKRSEDMRPLYVYRDHERAKLHHLFHIIVLYSKFLSAKKISI